MSELDLTKAIAAHQAGELDKAEKFYLKQLKKTRDFRTKQLLGLLYSNQNKFELAERHMLGSLRMNPMQPNVQNNLAICYKKQAKLDKAVEYFGCAIALQPGYVDAYRNLAATLVQQGRFRDSQEIAVIGLEANPDDAGLHNQLGVAKKELGDHKGAIDCFKKALHINPNHTQSQHNLGVAYRLNNQPQLALNCLERLLNENSSFELLHNIANAHSDLGHLETAVEYYERVLTLAPEYPSAYQNLSNLTWSLGQRENFLDCYEQAFARGVVTEELVLSYLEALLTSGQVDEAIAFLQTTSLDINDARRCDFLGRCHLEAGRASEAISFHEQACSEPDAPNPYWVDFAITLMVADDIPRATRILEQVYSSEPDNQMALAYLCACWRLQQDPRDKLVNNYDLVGAYEIPVPDGFATIDEFNQYLNKYLTSVHTSKARPLEQSVRQGTQTQGNLFARDAKPLRLLEKSFRTVINQYMNDMADLEPPYPGYNIPREFEFSASWSVKLRQNGYHEIHIHPMGWISACYYVDLPRVIDTTSEREGWIQFGEPNIELATPLPAQHAIKPAAGTMALFPSYMWHGTVPFKSDEIRTTVVVDIVPVPGG
ncbi:MAG: tetratricopeptide repeat protein [Proteobacteria bacterium]|nr:tetratricopeptide repeat protein [Pseudomonadota bacterium]